MNAAANAGSNAGLSTTSDREIVLTRVYDAPRDLVFTAWTDPRHLAKWYGPDGFTITTHEIDVRPGGHWNFMMHGPDGRDYPNRIVYHEVVRPERLVFAHGDDTGSISFNVIVTFEQEKKKTRVTLRNIFATAEERDRVEREHGAIEGGNQTMARLAEHLPTMEEFVISRTFAAPRDLVFKVWTDRDHLTQWWGPKGFKVFHCTNDPRPGGVMHYGMRAPDGGEMWGRWIYRAIEPPRRLEFISSFSDPEGNPAPAPFDDDWPAEILTTIHFEEQDGKTTVTVQWVPYNATGAQRATFDAGRDSMTGGWTGTFTQLESYLETL
ncbi:MAG TPA: SRPBCC family protein [Thermoanaerobaculia bacterium]|nr:SRPBCC family protein [Thermoanaerobaculia bacterium]